MNSSIARRACGAMLVLCVVGTAGAAAESVTLDPIKDATLYSNADGFLANGAGEFNFIGRTGSRGGGSPRRGLMEFDLSSIPAGATITSATLTMHVNWFRGGALNISLYPMLASWMEGTANAGGGESGGGGGGSASSDGDVTWIHRWVGGPLWNSPGGDFAATAAATTAVSGVGFYNWSSPGMVANLQSWIDNPSGNFGWMMKAPETAIGNTKRFDARESNNVEFRPRMEVTYTIPAPGAAALVMGLGAVASRRRRR